MWRVPLFARSASVGSWLIGCGIIGIVVMAARLAAGPATDPAALSDIPGFRTVTTAITAKVAEPKGTGSVRTGYLGVEVTPVEGKLLVDDVEASSPAERAGLRQGDVVMELDSEPVGSPELLRDVLQGHRPGDTIKLAVQRGDEPMSLAVILSATSRPMRLDARKAMLGVTIKQETDDGAEITNITPGLPAETAGLKPADVLLKIDGLPLSPAAHLSDALAQKEPGDTVTVVYRHDGREVEVRLQLVADRTIDPRLFQNPPTPIWKKDVYRLAVVGVEFPDVKHNPEIDLASWQEALFSEGVYKDKSNPSGQPVYGSLRDYYLEQSYGNLHVQGQMFDWVQVSKNRGEYAQANTVASFTPFLTEATDLLVKREGQDLLQEYDGVMFIYAGGPYPGMSRTSLFWPHRSIFPWRGKRLSYFIVQEGGPQMESISTPAHEFGHMLGMPDLYAAPGSPGAVGLGPWCAMSMQTHGGRPQHFSAWCKEELGWIKPTVIDPAVRQKLIMAPIEDSPSECFKIPVRADGSEYFLLENRRKIGFDQSIPGEGLLIWRIVNNRPVLEESHGVEGPNGPLVYQTSIPYPSIANNAFTPFTTPSSRSMVGGGASVYLTNIRKLPDGRVTFYVGYEFE